MPQVDIRHPEYEQYLPVWTKCRTVIEGEDAVKDAGQDFLPRLSSNQSEESYDGYKTRASFFAGTSRASEAINGMIFRKDPTIENVPETLQESMENIDTEGNSIVTFIKKVTSNIIDVGRSIVLVDMSQNGGESEPYLAHYAAENLINWKTDVDANGKKYLKLAALFEQVEDPDDEFGHGTTDRVRVLSLRVPADAEEGAAPVYTVQVYEKQIIKDEKTGEEHEEWVLLSTVVPMIRGEGLSEIPLVVINVKMLGPAVEKPPLLDVANVNLSLYRTSADLEHGRHWVALPTPWLAGFALEDNRGIGIGSGSAYITENENAKAGFLEFSGAGLNSLETASSEKKEEMANLGARLLVAEKAAVEAAETARLKKMGESSVVSSLAKTVGEGITTALRWWHDWRGGMDSEISVELNVDYLDNLINVEVLKVLMQAVISGQMSWPTFFFNLKRAELVPGDRTEKEEADLIDTGSPNASAMGNPTSGNDEENEEDDENEEEENQE